MENRSKRMLAQAQKTLGVNQKTLGTYIGVSARTVNSWMGRVESRTCPVYVAEMVLRLAQADAHALENGDRPSGMFRWAVISDDGFTEQLTVFGSRPEAIREAEMLWDHLTDAEKKKQERFEVGLVHVTLSGDEREPFTYCQYSDNPNDIDADVYEIAKDYLRK